MSLVVVNDGSRPVQKRLVGGIFGHQHVERQTGAYLQVLLCQAQRLFGGGDLLLGDRDDLLCGDARLLRGNNSGLDLIELAVDLKSGDIRVGGCRPR